MIPECKTDFVSLLWTHFGHLLPECDFLEELVIDNSWDPEAGALSFNFFFSGLAGLKVGAYATENQLVVVESCGDCGLGAYWLERRDFRPTDGALGELARTITGPDTELACNGCGKPYLDFLFARGEVRLPSLAHEDGEKFQRQVQAWATETLAQDPLSATVTAAELWNLCEAFQTFAKLGRELAAAVDQEQESV